MVGLTGASQFINLGRCIWVLLGPVFIEAKDPEVGEVNCLAVLKKIDHVYHLYIQSCNPGIPE